MYLSRLSALSAAIFGMALAAYAFGREIVVRHVLSPLLTVWRSLPTAWRTHPTSPARTVVLVPSPYDVLRRLSLTERRKRAGMVGGGRPFTAAA